MKKTIRVKTAGGTLEGDSFSPDMGRGISPYAWSQLHQGFAKASSDGPLIAAAWVKQWHEQAGEAWRGLNQKPLGLAGDALDLHDTILSLELLADWWLPSRTPFGASQAAAGLRDDAQWAVTAHRDSLQALIDDPKLWFDPDFTESLKARIGAMTKYAADSDFVGRIAFSMGGYDPRTSPVSPNRALTDAALRLLASVFQRDFPFSEDSKNTVAKEIRRRLRLADGDAQKTEVEAALGHLSAEHRNYLIALLGPEGSTDNARKALSSDGLKAAGNSKSERVRDEALRAMIELVPALASLPLKDASKSRVAHAQRSSQGKSAI